MGSDSKSEELIAVCYLIASGVFLLVGWEIFAYFLLGKAVLDTIAAIHFAFKETSEERRSHK